MTRSLATLVRWVCDPEKLEYLEGDLQEQREIRAIQRGPRAAARWYVWNALSICLRQSRLHSASMRLRLLTVAAAAAVVAILSVTGRTTAPTFYTIKATDPAGAFTLEIRDRRVVAATIDGNPVDPDRLVQSKTELVIAGADNGRDFRIALKPRGGIEWQARRAP
jgi:hypothetical protein